MKIRGSLCAVLILMLCNFGAGSLAACAAEADSNAGDDQSYNPLYDDANEDVQIQNTIPYDPVSGEFISRQALLSGRQPQGLTANRRFAPTANAQTPAKPFQGVLKLDNAQMHTSDEFNLGKGEVNGKDTTIFPDVAIKFFTVEGHLVPVSQKVILNGSLKEGTSYWDVIVQPGRVWQRADGLDDGWNRASFPFALVNRMEGETHTGIALFLYKKGKVSNLRFQIISETRPGEVPDYFNAWGATNAVYKPGKIDNREALASRYKRQVASHYATAPMHVLESLGGMGNATNFGGAQSKKQQRSILQSALFYKGVLYRSPCRTAAGPFPYCDQVRYGVWSVTKSAIMNVAMLHLAEKYGADFLDERIANYIEIPEDTVGWDNVTFMDLANMASGHGATEEDPTCYLCDYERWNLAYTEAEKISQALDYPSVWESGTKYVYRDQDAFLLGVALEKFLQSKQGDQATLEHMLLKEVFEPIGIYYLPINHTIEAGGKNGHLKAEFGYYPTLDDLAKIAMLYEKHGAWDGKQILDRALVDSLLPQSERPEMALRKEEDDGNEFGPRYYAMNWHIERYESPEGCSLFLSNMEGFGRNLVALLPGNTVAIRIANSPDEGFDSTVALARFADKLVPFCTE